MDVIELYDELLPDRLLLVLVVADWLNDGVMAFSLLLDCMRNCRIDEL
jgi:hypothetical protein